MILVTTELSHDGQHEHKLHAADEQLNFKLIKRLAKDYKIN